MKLLRILTGLHAGAQLQLAPGSHRIGSDDDADIRLTDWQGADALLEVDVTGVVRITRAREAGDASPHAEAGTVLLVDFVPMQFDEMVLCVGPDDTAWPSDLDLLSTLLASPVKVQLASIRQQQKHRRQLTAIAACVLLGGVVLAGALLATTQMSKAAFPPSADDRTLHVAQAIAASHVAGLHVQALGNTVVITGMVGTSNDDTAVRALLDRVAPYAVERKYDVARDDARSIEDSLGVPGAHVEYIGDGRFAITGKIASKSQLDAAVARVRTDLDANVKEIVVRADQIASDVVDSPDSYSEMVSSDDVKYAETPDGVKHIFAVDLPAQPASAADAGASLVSMHSEAPLPDNGPARGIDQTRLSRDSTASTSGYTPLPDPGSLPAAHSRTPPG
ncbi:type III secretion protein D [Burkholderia sp. D7]|nr:type III secretion protein D [Burkholderia sp. D7]